jgi:hypothetical protein
MYVIRLSAHFIDLSIKKQQSPHQSFSLFFWKTLRFSRPMHNGKLGDRRIPHVGCAACWEFPGWIFWTPVPHTVNFLLSGTLGEWGVPIDRFSRWRERWPTIRNFDVGYDENYAWSQRWAQRRQWKTLKPSGLLWRFHAIPDSDKNMPLES